MLPLFKSGFVFLVWRILIHPLLNFHLSAKAESAKSEIENRLLITPVNMVRIAGVEGLADKKSLFLRISKGRNVCFKVIINDLMIKSQSMGSEKEIVLELIAE
ncbi:hypothetical protein CWN40_27500 [Klebsiella quasipneumoniae]|nr:hypothetical protein CWN40_27500 [Klebsiella quasipneumoniae]